MFWLFEDVVFVVKCMMTSEEIGGRDDALLMNLYDGGDGGGRGRNAGELEGKKMLISLHGQLEEVAMLEARKEAKSEEVRRSNT